MSETDLDMYVIKRNGSREVLSYKKILDRTKKVGDKFENNINYTKLVMKIMDQLHNDIKSYEIDELMCQHCASMGSTDYDYYTLASYLAVSNHQKQTSSDFVENYKIIFNNDSGYLSSEFLNIIIKHQEYFESIIDYERDYLIDYFGFKTLERAYLMKSDNVIKERIQHLWLRVAIQIHKEDLEKVKRTYDGLSKKYFIHATPTLFNSGTKRPQLSSCYLQAMEDDSIDGIFNTLHDCASISKWAGGIGLHIHNVRGKNTKIVGTNGTSNGIVPMLKVFNNTARYVDQCVFPDTYIYTVSGPKQIQYVQQGVDQIYNEKGNIEVIQNVLEHSYNGNMIVIENLYCDNLLKITPEHPILSVCPKESLGMNDILNRINNKLLNIEYNEAKNLDTNSFILYKIPTYYKDIEALDESDLKMYGLMCVYLSNINNNDDCYILKFTRSMHVNYYIDFIQNYFNSQFIEYKIYKEPSGEKNYELYIKFKKNVNLKFNLSDFINEGKRVISSRLLNLPAEKTNKILDIFSNNADYPIELKEYVRFLKLKSGYFCQNCDGCFNYNGYIFTKINKIYKKEECITYNGVLYDLQMKNEHNYMIHNGIIHNGGGKRSGSFAIYLEPWHSDIEDFIELRKNHGDEEMRARDLFYALWIPDLFMKQVENDDYWYLMCPNKCPGLSDCYGEEFESLYFKYVNENKYNKKMKARELWFQILDSQMETGTPYMLYKDSVNKKSNQQNIGVIKSSNLCCEIMEYSNSNETAVCNLASISLSAMVDENNNKFDFDKLGEITETVTENLNNIIDVNYYPTPKTYNSNINHRPIGIGVQGLADCFAKLNLSFDSDEAQELNKQIFETIYYHSMKKSNEIAKERSLKIKNIKQAILYDIFNNKSFIGYCNLKEYINNNYYDYRFTNELSQISDLYHSLKPTMEEIFGKKGYKFLHYLMMQDINLHEKKNELMECVRNDTLCGAYSSFEGSPCSKGLLQFDLWNVKPSDRYDWDNLKSLIKKYGVRNSLCVAPMPTASTSQILANNECFEPFTSNIYSRRTLAGEFVIINKYLMKELKEIGLWNNNMKNMIIENKGSIQNIKEIPENIRHKYKIVWDMSMKRLIDMAKDRGAFICQSQSMNLWVEDPNYKNLTSMHFYAWRSGLKTGIYYLRRKARHQAQQFTIEPKKNINKSNSQEEEDNGDCLMCGA
jgi:ribonucleotide reductase alpha subunit